LVAERDRDGRVTIRGQYLEPARRLCGERPHVRVPLDLLTLVEQVADGRRGLQPQLVRQGSPVGIGVHGDDPIAAQRGQRRAQSHHGSGLAHAALEAQHRYPVVATRYRGARPGDQLAAADFRRGQGRAHQAAGDLVDRPAPARRGGGVPARQGEGGGGTVGGAGAPAPRGGPPRGGARRPGGGGRLRGRGGGARPPGGGRPGGGGGGGRGARRGRGGGGGGVLPPGPGGGRRPPPRGGVVGRGGGGPPRGGVLGGGPPRVGDPPWLDLPV